MKLMEDFVTRIVALAQPYFAENGGPVILAQIENEYGTNN